MNEPLLSARGLRAQAGERVLVGDIDLDLHPGQVVAVIGQSGSGKTTLGRALHGESAPGVALSGSVRLHGAELIGHPGARRRGAGAGKIARLPQHPAAALNPVRRVGKVLRELAALRHSSRHERGTAVREALRAAQLPGAAQLLRRYPHQLSGGQQQRIALAQALIVQPEVIVLDEPTSGADTVTRAETATALAELAGRGTALVLLTHDLALARLLAHEVLVLQDGSAVERGPGTEPLRAPAHEHTRTILASEQRVPERDEDLAPEQGEPLLRARRISREAEDGTALLHEVDLDVHRGQCLAVVGRSGAGKTVLARCLAGLARPRAGQITLEGTPLPAALRQRDREQRRRVQYVHQDARASFDDHRSVVDHVARTARLLLSASPEEARRNALDVLGVVGLAGKLTDRRPSELSGGQLQRAALARALLARPDVLICDEITSALDVVHQAEVLGTLARVKATRTTSILLISHDFATVAALADQVHVIDGGRLAESAPPHHLFAHPRSPAARELVAAARRTARSSGPSRA